MLVCFLIVVFKVKSDRKLAMYMPSSVSFLLCLYVCVLNCGGGVTKRQGNAGPMWKGGTATVAVSLRQPTISPCVASDKPRMKALFCGQSDTPHPTSCLPSRQGKEWTHDAYIHNHKAMLRGRYAYLRILCAFMYRRDAKSHRVHPFISFTACFLFFYDCVKMSFKLLAPRQEDLSVVISLQLITILTNQPSGLGKTIGGRKREEGESEGQIERYRRKEGVKKEENKVQSQTWGGSTRVSKDQTFAINRSL